MATFHIVIIAPAAPTPTHLVIQGKRNLTVRSSDLLWAHRKGKPSHGYPRGFVTFGDNGGSSVTGEAEAGPAPYEMQIWTTCLTQTREEYAIVSFDRAPEAPKQADDPDPLCLQGW